MTDQTECPACARGLYTPNCTFGQAEPVAYLDPLHEELDRLRTENERWRIANRHNCISAMEEQRRADAAEKRCEQAEARVNHLTDQLTLANDTLRHRATAVNATGATNDTLRANVARVRRLCDAADAFVPVAFLRAALADQEPTSE